MSSAHVETDTPSSNIASLSPANENLVPAIGDMKGYLAHKPLADACGPDYTITKMDRDHKDLRPTEKRIQYDTLAREAMNAPGDTSAGQPSDAERRTAAQVAELALKAQRDLATSTQNMDRTNDIKALNEIFARLDPQTAQRVINEANKTLEQNNLRLAQSAAGEIWMGKKDPKSDQYFLSAMLKKAPCQPIASRGN